MRDKIRRLRGSKRCGRGWKKSKSGSRGGTGRASLWDAKISTRILELKKNKLRKATSIEVIESKLERYLKKKIAIRKDTTITFPCGVFCKTYNKIWQQVVEEMDNIKNLLNQTKPFQ